MIFLKTRPQETLFRSFQLLVSVNGSFTNQQANVLCLGSQVKAKDNNDNAAGDDGDMMIMVISLTGKINLIMMEKKEQDTKWITGASMEEYIDSCNREGLPTRRCQKELARNL